MIPSVSSGHGEKPAEQSAAQKALLWASRDYLSHKVDWLGALASRSHIEFDNLNNPRNYTEIFQLDSGKNIQFKDFCHPKQYFSKVQKSFSPFCTAIKHRSNQPFFQGLTFKEYCQETLWRGNVQPIQEAYTNGKARDFSKLGSSLARLAGFGFMGFGIFRDTIHAYQAAQAQHAKNPELQASKQFLKSSAKGLFLWEVAGVGFAFGCKLLPAVGSLPLGGILAGVSLATFTDKTLQWLGRRF